MAAFHVFTLETRTLTIAASSHKEAAEKYVRGAPPGTKFGGQVVVFSHLHEGRVEKIFYIANKATGKVIETSYAELAKMRKKNKTDAPSSRRKARKVLLRSPRKSGKQAPPKTPLENKLDEPLRLRRNTAEAMVKARD